MKTKNIVSIALAALLALSPAVGAQATGFVSTLPANTKALILNLYYGQQQAVQRGFAATNTYILAHNYPGMYSKGTSLKCLTYQESASGIGYTAESPDLTSVMSASTWNIPTGIPQNSLAGTRPLGTTYVLPVTTGGQQSLLHVTILKGKAYFYMWVCGS